MNRKLILIIGLVCLVFISAGCKKRAENSSGAGGAHDDNYSINLLKKIQDVQSKLDIASKKPEAKNSKVVFSGNLFLAHGAFIPYFSKEDLIRYADGLQEAGVGRIDINPGIKPWITNDTKVIQKYDAVITHIKNKKLGVVINPQYTAGDFVISKFEDYEKPTLQAYEYIAQRYQPDIFIVAHEPSTMAKRMGIKISSDEWVNFIDKASKVIKKVSPSTRIGAGGLSSEYDLFKKFTGLNSLNVLTINIYGLDDLPRYNEMITLAQKADKSVYIAETWRFPDVNSLSGKNLETSSSAGIGLEKYKQLDQKWLEVMAQYASVWGLEAVTPFWTQTFFTYVDDSKDGNAIGYPYNKATADALAQGIRTETFDTYKNIISKYGK